MPVRGSTHAAKLQIDFLLQAVTLYLTTQPLMLLNMKVCVLGYTSCKLGFRDVCTSIRVPNRILFPISFFYSSHMYNKVPQTMRSYFVDIMKCFTDYLSFEIAYLKAILLGKRGSEVLKTCLHQPCISSRRGLKEAATNFFASLLKSAFRTNFFF